MELINIIIVVILIILLIYIVYTYFTYESEDIVDKQENYYNRNTFGYRYNGKVETVLKKALNRDKDEPSIKMAKNAKLIGDIYNYQMNDGETARYYYSKAISRLEAHQKLIGEKVHLSKNELNFNEDPSKLLNPERLNQIMNEFIQQDKEALKLADQIEEGMNSDNFQKHLTNLNSNLNLRTETYQGVGTGIIGIDTNEQNAIFRDIQTLRHFANNNTHDAIRVAVRAQTLGTGNGGTINTFTTVNPTQEIRVVGQQNRIISPNIINTRSKPNNPNSARKVHFSNYMKSDGQNVHDSELMSEAVNKYKRIKYLNGLNGKNEILTTASIDQLADTFQRYYEIKDQRDQDKVNQARFVVQKMLLNTHPNSKMSDNEKIILSEVWGRINSPDNSAKYPQLISALVDQLSDCVETKGYTVCEGGRVNRLIDTFTLMDSDDELSKPIKSKEVLKHEILPNMGKLLEDELEKLPEQTRNDYNSAKSTPEVEQFENHMKNLMIQTIDENYSDVNPRVRNQIKEEAIAGI